MEVQHTRLGIQLSQGLEAFGAYFRKENKLKIKYVSFKKTLSN